MALSRSNVFLMCHVCHLVYTCGHWTVLVQKLFLKVACRQFHFTSYCTHTKKYKEGREAYFSRAVQYFYMNN